MFKYLDLISSEFLKTWFQTVSFSFQRLIIMIKKQQSKLLSNCVVKVNLDKSLTGSVPGQKQSFSYFLCFSEQPGPFVNKYVFYVNSYIQGL